jgi:hypothetical protein
LQASSRNETGPYASTEAGIYVPGADLHIDPWRPVARALITHAHGDHARPGSTRYLATRGTAALIRVDSLKALIR